MSDLWGCCSSTFVANDYSMWNKWEPQDPVTLDEKARHDALVEKMKNDQFEQANPDFCTQFKHDLEKRQQSTRDKDRLAQKHKTQGNTYFKRRQYTPALASYMAALVEAPYCPLILTNIAQVHLRLNATDDALEFCNRALFVAPTHIKALSRKASILHGRGLWKDALDVVQLAMDVDKRATPDLVQQFVQIKAAYDDDVGREVLQRRMDAPNSVDNWHLHAMQHLLDQFDLGHHNPHESTEQPIQRHASGDKMDGDATGRPPNVATVDALRALLPLLQADKDCKLLFRTSGALTRVVARLVAPEAAEDDEVRAILQCLVAMATDDAATQHHLYLLAPFRQWVVDSVADTSMNTTRNMSLLFQLVDECMAVNLWKSVVATSVPMLAGLLRQWQAQESAESATSIVLYASEMEAGRHALTTTLIQPVLVQVLALLRRYPSASSSSTVQLVSGLGVLLNLTNHVTFRHIVATEQDVAHEMTKALVQLLTLRDEVVVAERSLAILLNLSLDPAAACIRQDMLAANVHEHVLPWLQRGRGLLRGKTRLEEGGRLRVDRPVIHLGDVGNDVVLVTRLVSVLCRLHSLDGAARDVTSTPPFLRALWDVFEYTADRPHDCWHLYAQLFCHLAWSFPTAAQFMDEHACVRRMMRFLQDKRTHVPKAQTAAFERMVTNCTKCCIAMLAVGGGDVTVAAIVESNGLELLVDLMSHMKDEKVARKNVAILLAKLCQRSDDIKGRVRALRGIEMMLSICRDLKG
ncbi:hypothetical protein DYB35_006978 [Aphanomyces astaci]|uniref:Uncharacterized protein n=1 Tax=Aphanomyces astaci TaxID=112090 RepID=A0A418DN65_APHAT|nr:hypothetical protein DYB35_006978 [Aphanomyces astaci]